MRQVNSNSHGQHTHAHTHTHTHTLLAEPPRKKPRKEKTNKVEGMMDRTLNTFLKYQQEAEERFERQEEERWKREVEKRRKADQEHEKAIIELLMRGPSHSYHQPATPFSFVHDNTY